MHCMVLTLQLTTIIFVEFFCCCNIHIISILPNGNACNLQPEGQSSQTSLFMEPPPPPKKHQHMLNIVMPDV